MREQDRVGNDAATRRLILARQELAFWSWMRAVIWRGLVVVGTR